MEAASRQLGSPLEYRQDTGQLLQRSGFTEVRHNELPIRLVENGGPKDPAPASGEQADAWQRRHGLAGDFRAAMGDQPNDDQQRSQPWAGMSMELLTRFRGYTQRDVEYLDERLVEAVNRNAPYRFAV